MKIDINDEKDTPLLAHKKVRALVTFEGATPSRSNIRTALAKKLDIKQELVVVKNIETAFGGGSAEILAHVYSKAEDAKRVETGALMKKHPEEKKKEPKAEEAKEETPVEEKSE